MNRLITNVALFTNNDQNTFLPDGAVAITGNRITAVGTPAALRAQFPDYPELDGHGRLLMPGLVNVHMHFYGTFARGLAMSTQPQNFYEILQQLWWKLDRALDLPGVYYSALLPAITGVKNGVTAVIDHHASPHAVAGSLDEIERALAQVGVRGLLCYEVSDRDGAEVRAAGLAENGRYIRHCQAAQAADPDHLYDGIIGLHASFTLEADTLKAAAELGRELGRGCHIHLLEDKCDETESQRSYGAGAVARLVQAGLLHPRSLVAHGIHLDEVGLAQLAASGALLTHQPQSNMNNAVGRADIFAMMNAGITVGLGTDGMTPDLRGEARTGYLLHKHHLHDNNVGWGEWQKMVLKNNPAIYQQLTGQKVGQITPGYLADMSLVDYYPPTPLTGDNFWGHFLYGIVDAVVDTTMINGRIVMQNKQVLGVDEAAVAVVSREVAAGVWARFEKTPSGTI